MDKIIAYILVNLVTWNPDKSMEIVREFLGGDPVIKPTINNKVVTPVVQQKKTPPKSKRDELLESLNYLKSKSVKTKQDKESIYTLEVILKNMV
jgi:hypothetical protein